MSKKLFSKIFVFLLVVGLLFAVAPTRQALAQTPTTTLNVAQWSETAPVGVTGRPSVLVDGTNYHLWYGPTDTTLYHSISTNPAEFSAGTPVTFSGGTPIEVASTAIFKEGTTFYMIAYGANNTTFALYSSTDGTAWTYVGVVFDATGMNDLGKIDAPFVFNDGGTFKLYFQKKSVDGQSYNIYLATSATVGGTYTLANSGNPVLSPTTGAWDGKFVMHPWVVKDGSTYYMWYSAHNSVDPQRIGLATSADGINWTKSPANPVIGPVGEPSVIKVADTWHMWYLGSGSAVQHLSATGPFEFQTIQAAITAAADGDTILVSPGTYNESILLNKPNITIKSTNGANATIIDVPDGTLTTGVLVDGINLGTIIFDGFTVKNFTENGIVQGMGSHDGTTFHVLNNIVMPKADYLRNGIQVSGNVSSVIGNIIQGAPLTEDWNGSGIMVVNASDVTVEDNFVNGGDNGITIQNYSGTVTNISVKSNTVEEASTGLFIAGRTGYRAISNITVEGNAFTNEEYLNGGYGINIQTTDISGLTVNENLIENVSYGFRISNTSATVVGSVTLWHNQFVYNYYHLLYYNDPASVEIDAEENWWDSIAGPADSGFGSLFLGTTGLVDYSPWCGDEDCSFLVYEADTSTSDAFQASIASTPAGDALYVASNPPAVENGYTVGGITLILGDGVTIQNNSPCFVVVADHTKITTATNGGAVCVPTEGDHGIVVNDGLTDITVEGLEIDGTGQTTGDGINFAGAVTDVTLRDNLIHDLDGDGVHFTAQPEGYVEIKGNLFMGNTGLGVNNAAGSSAIDATYNAWGDYAGPTGTNGDGVSAHVTSSPWTHVDVYVEYKAASSRYAGEVAVGESVTYDVKANLQNALGAQFTLTFDPTKLSVASTSTSGTVFPAAWGDPVAPGVTYNNTTGKITFAGGATSAVSGEDKFLFSVTFTGLDDTPDPIALSFDEADEALFGMNPGSGSSLNIYAAGMAGVADVNVYDLPTLEITPLATFAKNNEKIFTLTVSNPSTGRAYTNLDVDLSGLVATLTYGDSWEAYTQGDEIPVGALAVDSTATVDFRIIFTDTTDVTATVNLDDGTIPLVTQNFEFTVLDSYTVKGSVQMQGRTVRSGVSIGLANNLLPEYLYSKLSTDLMTGNYTLSNVAAGEYTLTIYHERYLDFTYTPYNLSGNDLDLTRLELRGGDVVNNNAIDISDASLIGTNYGSIGGNDADANFDETVNIFDLAMVGGNYGLTSGTAYASWTP